MQDGWLSYWDSVTHRRGDLGSELSSCRRCYVFTRRIGDLGNKSIYTNNIGEVTCRIGDL